MEVHPPSGAIHSVKDFAIHLAMIVLGILIAVSIEGCRESRHHDKLAREMRAQITAELAANEKTTAKALGYFKANIAVLEERAALFAKLAKGEKPAPDEITRVAQKPLDMRTPGLTSMAWDAALATQAVQYMPAQEVARYASLYSAQQYAMSIVLTHKSQQLLISAAMPEPSADLTPAEAREAQRGTVYQASVLASHLNNFGQVDKLFKDSANNATAAR
jgi:hypothetical protein